MVTEQSSLEPPFEGASASGDVERLLHELQVHQIELEMQNAELRRTQVELEISRNKFSNLYDFSPIGYFSIARDTAILEVNLHGSRMLDVARSEVQGKPFYVFVCAEHRRTFYSHLEDVFLHGKQISTEVMLQCRGRRRLWVRLDSILSYVEGKSEPHCRTSVIDISQQKLAEAHVATLAQAVDQSLDAVAIVDPQGRCTHANALFLELVHLSLENVRGEEVLGVLSRATLLRGAQIPQELFHASEHHRFTLHVPPSKTFPKCNVSERWYDVRVSPVLEARGEVANYVITFSDVSELRRAMAELTRAKERAESANSAKSQFLANMSHELRTPMNSVLGFSELLLADEVDEQKKRRLEAVSSAGKMLLKLLDDLLDLSRVEVGKLPLHHAPFDVRKLFSDAQQSFELKVRAKGLSFFVRVDDDVPVFLVGDEIRILQIISNLVNNAVKFTREGFVSVECSWHRGLFTCQVSDTGIGISEGSIERMFLPFEQDDSTSTREHQGSGLGLAIVKRLAEAMRGEVTLKSQVGVGTSVSVSLPLQTQSEPKARTPLRSLASRVFDEAQGARVRVLLADDCPMNRKLMTELLFRAGLACECVGDGEEAILALERCSFDLLLLDMQMPRKDGFEVLQDICARRARGEPVPWVVSVTAHALKGDEERMRDAGADAYLSKPVGIVSFMETLAAFRKERPEVGSLPIV